MTSVPFLKEIASLLLQSGEFDLSSTCVVFPNKRARLYMSRYLGELGDKPVWAPHYLTISELMEDVSGFVFADRISLLFDLYHAYREVTHTEESFDLFYPYSETLLADFDEIDKYLINANDLFMNLSGLKSLDGRFNYLTEDQLACIRRFWNTFAVDNISNDQSHFLTIWDSLSGIYAAFTKRLSEKGMAYEGMAYRQAVTSSEDNIKRLKQYRKYVFIGFNALNTCEQKLFRYLKNQGLAEFFWDYDTWYTNSEIHEAGYFIRENIKNFPQSKPLPNEHLTSKKNNILFIPVSSNTGQTAILPDVLKKLNIQSIDDLDKTALVLADETLLIPAIHSIPEFVTDINVTMGYPLSTSSVFSMVDSLVQLKKNTRKDDSGKITFFIKDVLTLMGNPVLRPVYAEQIEFVRKIAIEQHKIYLNADEIPGLDSEDPVFNEFVYKEPCRYLLDILTGIIRKFSQESVSLQNELLFQVYTLLSRLNDVVDEQQFNPGSEVMFRLIKKMLRNMHVPFSGEPLAGLQVLGILETRTLDFENVIMLSVNEGILPASAAKPSFIPYNLRAGFGLPGPEHHDAIYAYYFYRLIQRANNIALIYDAGTGGLKTGERSRFMHQLYYEMQLPIKIMHIENVIKPIPTKAIVVQKKEHIRVSLERYTGRDAKTLSPSALNEFLNCPLKFYFHHIASLPQPEELIEEVDARLFGSILHATLKLLFRDLRNILITEEKLSAGLKNEQFLNECIDEAFNAEFYKAQPGEGRREPRGYNLIVRQVIYSYIRQFVRLELSSCPYTIVSLEEKFFIPVKIKVRGAEKEIKIGGIIDRIDRQQGFTRILDYKTGSPKNKFSSVAALFNGEEGQRNDAVFQVFLYSHIYQKLYPDEKIKPGLYFLRQSFEEDFTTNIFTGNKKSQCIDDFSVVHEEFESLLTENLERLFNFELPFEQTINLNSCRYCPYAMICRR
jgi:CRISPR/Cas system-associated exonuclease Cas4 (RecB family)